MLNWIMKAIKPKEKPAKTVLVIDDEATTRTIIRQTLAKSGYEVLTAQSGEQGLAIAKQNIPDIIMIDVLMPGMDGFMLLKEIKRQDALRDKPIIVLTSRENVGDTLRRFGADSFLNKPVDPVVLLKEIEKLTGK